MSIELKCSGCAAVFRVKDELAGRKARCATCKAVVRIPGKDASSNASLSNPKNVRSARGKPAGKPAKAQSKNLSNSHLTKVSRSNESIEQRTATVLGGFQGEIDRVRPALAYRFGIILAACVMILLPVIYVGLIALTGWIVYWHLTHNVGMLAYGRGRARLFVLLAYLAPLIGGAMMVLFMVKPIFARPSDSGRTRSLTLAGEPLLFAFVERICAVVGAPMPVRIDLHCQVNASAAFRRSWLSMITGNDLVLTIGMPLVAGFSMRQLGGVLAHEFGHFSQGAGMRLTFIVRTISHWFTRVVYERDEWDVWLSNTVGASHSAFALVVGFAGLCVWLTRCILWVFMKVGHLVSGYLLRQMEFDADRYEARLAGSAEFGSTCLRLHEIEAAHTAALSALQEYFDLGKLGNNMPLLIRSKLDDLPLEFKRAVANSISESTTDWLATHPSDKDRIKNAERENAPGIFTLERPAADLFQHYDKLCEGTTWDFYRSVLGPGVKPNDLKPMDELISRQQGHKAARAALERFFDGEFQAHRPLRVPTSFLQPPDNARVALKELQQARKAMVQLAASYKSSVAKYTEAESIAAHGLAAAKLYRTKIKVPKSMFKFPDESSAKKALNKAKLVASRTETNLEEFERATGQRLVAACRLLYVKQVVAKVDNASDKLAEAKRLIPAVAELGRQLPLIRELRNHLGVLSTGLSQIGNNRSHELLVNSIHNTAGDVQKLIIRIGESLQSIDYPFESADSNTSLSGFLIPVVPDDVVGAHNVAEELLERSMSFHRRAVGRIVEIVEAVEKALQPKRNTSLAREA